MKTVQKEAIMWKIERLDGQVLGFSNHSHDLIHDGLKYHASIAVSMSEIDSTLGVGAEYGEVFGGVDHQLITRQDIIEGCYSGANVEQFLYDWDQELRLRTLFLGQIGQIELVGNQFRAELHSAFDQLNQVFGRSYRKECDAKFCDEKCSLNSKDYQFSTQILKIDGECLWVEPPITSLSFQSGVLLDPDEPTQEFGIQSASKDARGLKLILWERPKRSFREGQELQLICGCDKNFETCATCFSNGINFRGFPHMPGEKILNAKIR